MGKYWQIALRQPVCAIQLENTERENFNGSLAKLQIPIFPHQNFMLYGSLLTSE